MAAPQFKAVLIATPQMRSESGLTFRSKQSAVCGDVEQNQLVSVAVRVGFEIICCKAHEICVFSKMNGENL